MPTKKTNRIKMRPGSIRGKSEAPAILIEWLTQFYPNKFLVPQRSTVLGAVAELERSLIVERVKAGLRKQEPRESVLAGREGF
jgi:hypothetical protein